MAEEDYAYAVLRVVPDVERGEALNAAVVLFCRRLRFLALRSDLDEARLRALDPGYDAEAIREHLARLERIAAGDRDAGAVAALPPSERFGWLTAPSSTVVQPAPVHTGLTDDPEATLARLLARLVSAPRR